MAGGFGQALYDSLKSRVCPGSDLPGTGVVHDDERAVGSGSENCVYPRVIKLLDGTFLAGFTRYEGDRRKLCIVRSTDNGWSFHNWGSIEAAECDVGNMSLVEIPSSSKILAAFRNHISGMGTYTYFRITVCASTDGGRNWVYLDHPVQKYAPYGIWEPCMRIGRQGEVQLYFSLESPRGDQLRMLMLSNDEGETWSAPEYKVDKKQRFSDAMTGFAKIKGSDGREALFMVFETTRWDSFTVEGAVSYDDGASWHYRQEIYVPRPGRNAGAPQVASFADGSMVLVFMTDEDAQMMEWPHHATIKAIFSGPLEHGKAHWSEPVLVSPASSYWPSVVAIGDYAAVAVYQRRGILASGITWETKAMN